MGQVPPLMRRCVGLPSLPCERNPLRAVVCCLPAFARNRWVGLLAGVAVTASVLPLLSSAPAGAQSDEANSFLAAVNTQRSVGRNCGRAGYFAPTAPLALDPRLGDAAERHSVDLAERGKVSHVGRDGSRLTERVSRSGYAGVAREVVGSGFTRGETFAQAMFTKASTCALLMSTSARDTGLGVAAAKGTSYWTAVLAAPGTGAVASSADGAGFNAATSATVRVGRSRRAAVPASALGSPGATPPAALALVSSAVEPPANPAPGAAQTYLDAINAQRAGVRSCGSFGTFGPSAPLRWNDQLAAAAAAHSADQASRNVMSHTGSDGSDGGVRMARQVSNVSAWGENVAYNFASLASVVDVWIKSPGHCRNLMSSKFSDVGMAVAYSPSGNSFWTQDFAALG